MTYQRKINLWINTYVYINICMYTFASEYFLYWNLTDSLLKASIFNVFYFGPKLLKFLSFQHNDISKLKVQTHFIYRVFYKYCVFSKKKLWFFWTRPALLQRWFSTCLVCSHTLTPRENRERPESRIFLKIFYEHPAGAHLNTFLYFPPQSGDISRPGANKNKILDTLSLKNYS